MAEYTNCFGGSSHTNEDNSLNMAKDHSKRQFITDIAISKVPFIRYPGIPEYAYAVIQEVSKDTLRISREENECREVAIAFSLKDIITGHKPNVGISLGGEHDVDPEDSVDIYHLLYSERDCVLVLAHNHPSTATFSISDIAYFIRHINLKLMIAVTNSGSIYYMIRKENFSYENARNLLYEAVVHDKSAKTLKERIAAAKFFLSNCSSVGIVYGHQY